MFLTPRLRSTLVIVVLASVALATTPLKVGAQSTQPAREPNADAAILALQPYKLLDEELPDGYGMAFTNALNNPAMALEYVNGDPPHPDPAEKILAKLVGAGRIVGLRALYEGPPGEDWQALRYSATLFNSPRAANAALSDGSLLVFVFPQDQVSRADAPALGDSSFAYDLVFPRGDGGDEYVHLLLWRRGPVVFTLTACCERDFVAEILPEIYDSAARADARFAALAAPASAGPSPSYMPGAARQLELYRQLEARLTPDEAFAGLGATSTGTIANAMILNDADTAVEPVSDPRALYERLVQRERRILGLTRLFQSPRQTVGGVETVLPTLSVGYHLYADSGGAAEALRASPAELSLRLSEEHSLVTSREMPLTEIAAPVDAPEGARAFRTRAAWEGGEVADVVTVRWLRGNVELFADLAVWQGRNPDELIARAIRELDATYLANPLEFTASSR